MSRIARRLLCVACLLVLAADPDLRPASAGASGAGPTSAQNAPPFRVAILLNTSRPPERADLTRVFSKAADLLFERTGERMVQTDLADVGRGSAVVRARAYLAAHASNAADGLLLLSDDSESRTYGAYSTSVPLPEGLRNGFPSPVEGDRDAYLAVVDFFHLYAKCGYDRRLNRVSARSRGGECRGTPGLLCVDNGRYWMCPDSTADPHANPDHFIGCAIVHEFLHPFGELGDDDHYGTPQCRARTGMTASEAGDRERSQMSCGICPDLFEKFRHNPL